MRYLITGGTGFIGNHLCQLLAERGHSLVALVRTPSKAQGLPEGTEILPGDLSLFAAADVELPEVDVIVHLAGVVAADSPEQYEAINYSAVKDLVACVERQRWKPRRLLFASSLAAAGPSELGRPWTERDLLHPIEPYGDAKARAESIVNQASYPTTTFRPPIVLGAGDPATLTLFRAARLGVGMRVAGAPQRLSWVDVRDLVRAIVLMAEDERPGHQTYYASNPQQTDQRQLWDALGGAFGRKVRALPVPKRGLYAAMRLATAAANTFGFHNQLDDKQYRQLTAPAFECCSDALVADLGWRAEHDLVAATTDALAGYRALGMLPG